MSQFPCLYSSEDLELKSALKRLMDGGFGFAQTSVIRSWDGPITMAEFGNEVAVVSGLHEDSPRALSIFRDLANNLPKVPGIRIVRYQHEVVFPSEGRIFVASLSNLDYLRGLELKAIFLV